MKKHAKKIGEMELRILLEEGISFLRRIRILRCERPRKIQISKPGRKDLFVFFPSSLAKKF